MLSTGALPCAYPSDSSRVGCQLYIIVVFKGDIRSGMYLNSFSLIPQLLTPF